MAKKKVRTKGKKITQKKTPIKNLSRWIMALSAKFVGFFLSLALLFLAAVYIGIFGPLPKHSELAKINNNIASEVYAHNGELMGKYYKQNRMSIANKQISIHAINALVATEDSRFFEHHGYDPISLGRVMFRTILLGDKRQGGGSTIGQQLSKNLYPRQSFGALSMAVNKTKEIFIAARLEKVYTKDEILVLYLNTVPFGENVYGIEAASQRFFHKSSAALEAQEAAVLIGMLAANTAYNPRLNPERSIKRRNVVLGRMAKPKFISQTEADSLKSLAIKLDYYRIDHNSGIAPYFRKMIKAQAQEILSNSYGNEYDLSIDGLKIYTTIDAGMQAYADEAVQSHISRLQNEFKRHWQGKKPWATHPEVYENEIKQSSIYRSLKAKDLSEQEIQKQMSALHPMTIFAYPQEKQVQLSSLDSISHYLKILNTGFAVMDPTSGAILSWVGGVNHKYFQYDHVKARRQVGSTFKPIVYAAALQEGMQPCEYFSNERHVYKQFDNWSPRNASDNYEGYYSMKGGLSYSVNTVTAAVMAKTGIDKVLELAYAMGIESRLPAVASISLGTGEISLEEMLTAYSCFANEGKRSKPFGLERIEDRNGNILYERPKQEQQVQVFDSETAQTMTYMLSNVVNKGTARSLRNTYGLRGDLAGKTGTTQDNADGWFIAYNPKLLAGAWVGAKSPAVHFRSTALGQGAHTALPIFGLFMQKLERDEHYKHYAQASFKALTLEQREALSCPDFVEKDPNKRFLERIRPKEKIELHEGLKESETKEAPKEKRKKTRKWMFWKKDK